jgi:hypothetical protein
MAQLITADNRRAPDRNSSVSERLEWPIVWLMMMK